MTQPEARHEREEAERLAADALDWEVRPSAWIDLDPPSPPALAHALQASLARERELDELAEQRAMYAHEQAARMGVLNEQLAEAQQREAALVERVEALSKALTEWQERLRYWEMERARPAEERVEALEGALEWIKRNDYGSRLRGYDGRTITSVINRALQNSGRSE